MNPLVLPEFLRATRMKYNHLDVYLFSHGCGGQQFEIKVEAWPHIL